jgi:hypothetical protein
MLGSGTSNGIESKKGRAVIRKRKHSTGHRGNWQCFYSGRNLLAIIEQHPDGWHVIAGGKDIGVCADREAALKIVDRLRPPSDRGAA